MLQTCTRNDLIRFIYRETNLAETLAVRQALDNDIFLREAYEELSEGHRHLPKATFSAAPSVVRSIMAYSAQTALEQQH